MEGGKKRSPAFLPQHPVEEESLLPSRLVLQHAAAVPAVPPLPPPTYLVTIVNFLPYHSVVCRLTLVISSRMTLWDEEQQVKNIKYLFNNIFFKVSGSTSTLMVKSIYLKATAPYMIFVYDPCHTELSFPQCLN